MLCLFYILLLLYIPELLKLKLMRANRRQASYGFPVSRFDADLAQILKLYRCICVIDQQPHLGGALAYRLPCRIIIAN